MDDGEFLEDGIYDDSLFMELDVDPIVEEHGQQVATSEQQEENPEHQEEDPEQQEEEPEQLPDEIDTHEYRELANFVETLPVGETMLTYDTQFLNENVFPAIYSAEESVIINKIFQYDISLSDEEAIEPVDWMNTTFAAYKAAHAQGTETRPIEVDKLLSNRNTPWNDDWHEFWIFRWNPKEKYAPPGYDADYYGQFIPTGNWVAVPQINMLGYTALQVLKNRNVLKKINALADIKNTLTANLAATNENHDEIINKLSDVTLTDDEINNLIRQDKIPSVSDDWIELQAMELTNYTTDEYFLSLISNPDPSWNKKVPSKNDIILNRPQQEINREITNKLGAITLRYISENEFHVGSFNLETLFNEASAVVDSDTLKNKLIPEKDLLVGTVFASGQKNIYGNFTECINNKLYHLCTQTHKGPPTHRLSAVIVDYGKPGTFTIDESYIPPTVENDGFEAEKVLIQTIQSAQVKNGGNSKMHFRHFLAVEYNTEFKNFYEIERDDQVTFYSRIMHNIRLNRVGHRQNIKEYRENAPVLRYNTIWDRVRLFTISKPHNKHIFETEADYQDRLASRIKRGHKESLAAFDARKAELDNTQNTLYGIRRIKRHVYPNMCTVRFTTRERGSKKQKDIEKYPTEYFMQCKLAVYNPNKDAKKGNDGNADADFEGIDDEEIDAEGTNKYKTKSLNNESYGNIYPMFRCWPVDRKIVTEPIWSFNELAAVQNRGFVEYELKPDTLTRKVEGKYDTMYKHFVIHGPVIGSAFIQQQIKQKWGVLLYTPAISHKYVIETATDIYYTKIGNHQKNQYPENGPLKDADMPPEWQPGKTKKPPVPIFPTEKAEKSTKQVYPFLGPPYKLIPSARKNPNQKHQLSVIKSGKQAMNTIHNLDTIKNVVSLYFKATPILNAEKMGFMLITSNTVENKLNKQTQDEIEELKKHLTELYPLLADTYPDKNLPAKLNKFYREEIDIKEAEVEVINEAPVIPKSTKRGKKNVKTSSSAAVKEEKKGKSVKSRQPDAAAAAAPAETKKSRIGSIDLIVIDDDDEVEVINDDKKKDDDEEEELTPAEKAKAAKAAAKEKAAKEAAAKDKAAKAAKTPAANTALAATKKRTVTDLNQPLQTPKTPKIETPTLQDLKQRQNANGCIGNMNFKINGESVTLQYLATEDGDLAKNNAIRTECNRRVYMYGTSKVTLTSGETKYFILAQSKSTGKGIYLKQPVSAFKLEDDYYSIQGTYITIEQLLAFDDGLFVLPSAQPQPMLPPPTPRPPIPAERVSAMGTPMPSTQSTFIPPAQSPAAQTNQVEDVKSETLDLLLEKNSDTQSTQQQPADTTTSQNQAQTDQQPDLLDAALDDWDAPIEEDKFSHLLDEFGY